MYSLTKTKKEETSTNLLIFNFPSDGKHISVKI